eukprot:scaffold98150_cov102-Phaeocystis_antarctica.AAC.3
MLRTAMRWRQRGVQRVRHPIAPAPTAGPRGERANYSSTGPPTNAARRVRACGRHCHPDHPRARLTHVSRSVRRQAHRGTARRARAAAEG